MLVSHGAVKVFGFAAVVAVTRWVSEADYGLYAYAMGLVASAVPFMGFGAYQAFVRYSALAPSQTAKFALHRHAFGWGCSGRRACPSGVLLGALDLLGFAGKRIHPSHSRVGDGLDVRHGTHQGTGSRPAPEPHERPGRPDLRRPAGGGSLLRDSDLRHRGLRRGGGGQSGGGLTPLHGPSRRTPDGIGPGAERHGGILVLWPAHGGRIHVRTGPLRGGRLPARSPVGGVAR